MARIKNNWLQRIMILLAVGLILGCTLFLNGNDDDKPQSLIIAAGLSVGVTLIMILVERGVAERMRKSKFAYLIRDDYLSYSFEGKTEDEIKFTSTKLSDTPNPTKCKIISGEDCDLEMWVSASGGDNDWTWRGLITMTSPNTGEIAYYHTQDSNLSENGINSSGYKRLTAFERSNPHEIRIMISQNDKNTNFGREVFIAKINKTASEAD